MKSIVAVTVAVVFAALFCQLALFSEERPAGRPREDAEARRTRAVSEEMQKLMERLREINQNEDLRALSREAGQDEAVQKTRERVRKAQEVLQKAQENAMRALDRAVAKLAKDKGNKKLLKLVQEQRDLTEKMRELRQKSPRPTGGRPWIAGAGPRPPRGAPGDRPAAE